MIVGSTDGAASQDRPGRREGMAGQDLLLTTGDRSGAPGQARRALRERHGRDPRLSGCLGDLELLVTELVTNAVVHARSAAQVWVTVSDDVVRVAVTSQPAASGRPHVRTPDEERPGGRGLHIVARLSCRWGISRQGTCVWLEIDHANRAVAAVS